MINVTIKKVGEYTITASAKDFAGDSVFEYSISFDNVGVMKGSLTHEDTDTRYELLIDDLDTLQKHIASNEANQEFIRMLHV